MTAHRLPLWVGFVLGLLFGWVVCVTALLVMSGVLTFDAFDAAPLFGGGGSFTGGHR